MADETKTTDETGGIEASGVSFLGNKIDKLRVSKGAVMPLLGMAGLLVIGWLMMQTLSAQASANDAIHATFDSRLNELEKKGAAREDRLAAQIGKNDAMLDRVEKRLGKKK